LISNNCLQFIFQIFSKTLTILHFEKVEKDGALKQPPKVQVFGEAIDSLLNLCKCKEAFTLKIQTSLVADDDIKAEIKVESNGNTLINT